MPSTNKKKALNIALYLRMEHENFLLNHFPLGPNDEMGTSTQVGEKHKQVYIHRESLSLTEAQAEILEFLEQKMGANVNIKLAKSLIAS